VVDTSGPGTGVVNATFPIGELVERTGIPASTIHHYRQLGLIPPPTRVAPNRFLYGERHVEALRLVRMLRERRHLPLETIREVVPDLLGEDEEALRTQIWDEMVEPEPPGGADLRAAILEAARAAFAKHGYAAVSVGDVADAAGVGKGTVYRHFRSKDDLFQASAESSGARTVVAFRGALAGGGRGVGVEQAAAVLADALAPEVTLLLEFVTRALQRQTGLAEEASAIFEDLAEHVGDTMGDPDAGERVVHAAMARAVLIALDAETDEGP
jgi:AcrR family transcriptional regulator